MKPQGQHGGEVPRWGVGPGHRMPKVRVYFAPFKSFQILKTFGDRHRGIGRVNPWAALLWTPLPKDAQFSTKLFFRSTKWDAIENQSNYTV